MSGDKLIEVRRKRVIEVFEEVGRRKFLNEPRRGTYLLSNGAAHVYGLFRVNTEHVLYLEASLSLSDEQRIQLSARMLDTSKLDSLNVFGDEAGLGSAAEQANHYHAFNDFRMGRDAPYDADGLFGDLCRDSELLGQLVKFRGENE